MDVRRNNCSAGHTSCEGKRSRRSAARQYSLPFIDPIDFVEGLAALDGWASGMLLCDARFEPCLFESVFEGRRRSSLARYRPARHGRSQRCCRGSRCPQISDPLGHPDLRNHGGTCKLVSHTLASLCRTVTSRSNAAESLIWGTLGRTHAFRRFAGFASGAGRRRERHRAPRYAESGGRRGIAREAGPHRASPRRQVSGDKKLAFGGLPDAPFPPNRHAGR